MTTSRGLARNLGLVGLVATGVCSMMGAGINVVPFVLQRNVPGIGPYVLPAYLIAAVPAVLAALAYATLASAMPRAGGGYVFASRGLHPYLGFVASFSQWFGLSVAIGVISYVLVPFLRDTAAALGASAAATTLDSGPVRLMVALGVLWTFVLVNLRGIGLYQRTVVPLMVLMFALGGVVIVAGFGFDHADFAAQLLAREGRTLPPAPDTPFRLSALLSASAVLFSSFIGFDSIAQAGGEARDPSRNLPLATGLAVLIAGAFYFLFVGAVYHAVPWQHVATEAAARDVSAPGLLGTLLSPGWTAAILAGAAVALLNDLPAMLLSVSRLMFAWAADGIFPRAVGTIHPVRRTPTVALLLCGVMASLAIVGSHVAGDFFLGVDILVTSMLVNFLVMCLTVIALPYRNPPIAAALTFGPPPRVRVGLAAAGAVSLAGLLGVHVLKDLRAPADAWYYHSTPIWLVVMLLASAVYARELARLRRRGIDPRERFGRLPIE